jgi:hypothetical protein
MLTCDQTFDCLTDPIHRHNESVEQHLDACPRCRDMADALEPALDLFGEVNEVETWQLPMASGEYELEEQPRVDRASDADNVIAGCVACHLKMAALADMEPMHRQHAQTLVNRCVECHLEIAMHSTDTDVAISRTADPASHSLLANCLFGRGS